MLLQFKCIRERGERIERRRLRSQDAWSERTGLGPASRPLVHFILVKTTFRTDDEEEFGPRLKCLENSCERRFFSLLRFFLIGDDDRIECVHLLRQFPCCNVLAHRYDGTIRLLSRFLHDFLEPFDFFGAFLASHLATERFDSNTQK